MTVLDVYKEYRGACVFQERIKVVREHGAFRYSTFACHCASRQLNLLVDVWQCMPFCDSRGLAVFGATAASLKHIPLWGGLRPGWYGAYMHPTTIFVWPHCFRLSGICSLRWLTQLFSQSQNCLEACFGNALDLLLLILVTAVRL